MPKPYRAMFFFLLWAAGPSFAASPDCLVQFASLSPESQRIEELAAQTYAELWTELGKHAPHEVIEATLKKGDPFAIEEGKADLGPLRKHLEQFRQLLVKSGGDTPSLRERLLHSLREKLGDGARSREKIDRALDRTWSEMKFPYDAQQDQFAVTADGRWLVYVNEKQTGQNYQIDLVDMQTRQTSRIDTPELKNTDTVPAMPLMFAHGGLVIPQENERLLYIPFEDGQLDWKGRTEIGRPEAHRRKLGYLQQGTPPEIVYASPDSAFVNIERFDLAAKKNVPLQLSQVTGESEKLTHWQTVPGRDGVFLTFHRSLDAHVTRHYNVAADGGLTLVKDYRRAPGINSRILKADTDGTITFHDKEMKGIRTANGGNATTKFAYSALAKPEDRTFVNEVGVRPGTDELYVVYRDAGSKQGWVRVYDPESGEVKGTLPLPENSVRPRFSPDGQKLLVPLPWVGEKQIVVINPGKATP